ncbi:hypothetical protein M413DRAFT_235543 [Hebeloma cylindrosporum]|uniref:Protein kinase domain-containing protein n=1 Tax=Hebeloma cylindrosporum TaxID=76867 RepID=A0A0C2XN22_HEBCY|nr:hypothetical protein M413DRAFT_235543 [Hebeloma cylindrosporum h7]
MADILADETGIYPALDQFLEMKYPSTLTNGPWMLTPRNPIFFLDRHISPFLSLKSIKPFGFSVARYLCELCDEEITDFVRREGPLLAGGLFYPMQPPQRQLRDAFDVLDYYVEHVADLATRFPSKFYFHPTDPDWNALYFLPRWIYEHGLDRFNTPTSLRAISNHQFAEITLPPDEEMLSQLRALQDLKNLAIYEMFDMEASGMIQKMEPIPLFDWEMTKATKYNSANLTPVESLPDASTGLVAKIEIASRSVKAQSKRKPPKAPIPSSKRVKKEAPNNGSVYIAPRRGERQKPYDPKGTHFLQHAWTRAVESDATFLVFHCGKYERIGIRHRETQTLYLSELIDPSTQECYGKMQVGLQLAIIKDLLDRQAADREKKKVPSKRKRNAETDVKESVGNKKRRKDLEDRVVVDSNPSSDVVENLLASRHVALMRIHFGGYQSPAPSSFLRVGSSCAPSVANMPFKEPKGNTTYLASDYFTITLTEQISRGAVGTIYKASALFRLGSKTVEYSRLVVKMAFSEKRQEGLAHEYEIYQHLARVKCTENILPVHGLFRDAETGALALVMDIGGINLISREIQRGGDSSYTQEERCVLHLR